MATHSVSRSLSSRFGRSIAWLLALAALLSVPLAAAQEAEPPAGGETATGAQENTDDSNAQDADEHEGESGRADEDGSEGTRQPGEPHIEIEPPQSEPREEGPLAILSSNDQPLPFGQIGLEYRYRFVGFGGTLPYSWQLSDASGPLPDGLFLDPETGLLAGQPEVEGVFELTIRLVDGDETAVEKTFQLRVRGDPFTLRELPVSRLDGRVTDEEYAESAPFHFPLGEGSQDCTVYVRQSGGTLTIAMIIEQVFLVRNRVRVLLAEASEPIGRVFAFDFDPFHIAHDTYRQEVLLYNQFNERPSFTPMRHEGWLGRADTLFADRWQAEMRINLSEIGILSGTSTGSLLMSVEVYGADEAAAFAPPRDSYDGYFNPSNYLTLRSVDEWGRRDERVLISADQVAEEQRRLRLLDMLLAPVLEDLESLQRLLQNLARQVERWQQEHGETEIPRSISRQVNEVLRRYVEKQQEYVDGVDRLLRINRNYYPYLHNIARDFVSQARNPLPGVEPERLWRDALRFARRALEHNPMYLPSRMVEALALQRLGQHEDALSRYERMYIEYPNDIALALEVAQLHIRLEMRARRELGQREAECQQVAVEWQRVERDLQAAVAREDVDAEDVLLLEMAVEAARERPASLERAVAELRGRADGYANQALHTLDGIAAAHRSNGRVTLACATLLYNLDRRQEADKYIAMTLYRAQSDEQLSLAIELVAFLGHQREFERMRAYAEQLAERYGAAYAYHHAVAQEFKRHHLYDEALRYAAQGVEHLPEQVPAGLDPSDFARICNAVAVEWLIALGNAEAWDQAALAVQEVERLLIDPAPREQPSAEGTEEREAPSSARQTLQRYRDLVNYPIYATEEREARAADESHAGSPHANPRLTLRLRPGTDGADDDEAEPLGEVVIELFRHDAPELVEHLRQAIADGWFEEDAERRLGGGVVQSLTRAYAVTFGPSGRGTVDAPTTSTQLTGRRHFRGAVSLVAVSGRVGLALQIDTATLPWLNDTYPVIGRVVSGLDVLDRLYRDNVRVEWMWSE